METSNTPDGKEKIPGFFGYAAKRVLLGLILAVVGIWLVVYLMGFFDKKTPPKVATHEPSEIVAHTQNESPSDVTATPDSNQGMLTIHSEPFASTHETPLKTESEPVEVAGKAHNVSDTDVSGTHKMDSLQIKPGKQLPEKETATLLEDAHKTEPQPVKAEKTTETVVHKAPKTAVEEEEDTGHRPFQKPLVIKEKGVLFVESLIEPLNHELTERWWGWRPNDIINLTDNVNNEQMGVIEFTRRTSIVLMERISRTGATAAYDENLQLARSSFMINADQYWLPSPEDEYQKGLKNLKEYSIKLENGLANFYTRNDNLIPLLAVYEDLLGGCEENLVKQTEENGEPVSFYDADDYFYYAKGVAKAMLPVLEAISVEFDKTIEARRGTDVIHHAIEALHHAVDLDPIIVTNSDLDGILANHRANLAAPISHARFYLGVLIKTLST